jgi:hypothetical protein
MEKFIVGEFKMKKIILIILLMSVISCKTIERTIIYKLDVPEFVCPERIIPMWDLYSIDKTEEENLLVEGNNIAMTKRLIDNLENIIECYKRNFETIKKLNDKNSETND